ncbi:MAG: hypothetical protein AB1813_27040, partial [Verrucomicrobiota bacterium]
QENEPEPETKNTELTEAPRRATPPRPRLDQGDSLAAKPTLGKVDTPPKLMTEPEEERHASARPRPRPRTLAEVQKKTGGIQGERMKQEGGVKNVQLQAAFDVKETAFGAYDAAFIAAVSKRWHDLLDSSEFIPRQAGKVVLYFYLHYNGRITEMKILENTVSETQAFICQRAIEDPAPYAAWPSDMRRLIGRDVREVTFTFHYLYGN